MRGELSGVLKGFLRGEGTDFFGSCFRVLGGLGKFMDKEMGSSAKTMKCAYVLPVQGHPGSLCNHW